MMMKKELIKREMIKIMKGQNKTTNDFMDEYDSIKENGLISNKLMPDANITVTARHAYCQNYGMELMGKAPTYTNTHDKETPMTHERECGHKTSPERVYPGIVLMDKYNNEIKLTNTPCQKKR